jgi:PAS domain S-box-containing protein
LKAGFIRNFEITYIDPKGNRTPVEINGTVMESKGERQILTLCRDITERKQAEIAVAAEKERLAVTLRSIGDAVIATDVRGDIVLMNKVAEDLTGWPLTEATGKPLSDVFNVVNEMTREHLENPVEKVLLSGKIIELANHTLLISHDGTERVIADSGAPIKDGNNKIIGVVLVFRDITEKQKFMDTIQRTAKLDSLGILAGGIAHDFNNLLTGIYGYMDLARVASTDARISEYLEAMLSTMKRAKALTLQLLTFAKGGSPVQKITPLPPFIKETAQFALSGSNISCRFSLAENLRPCNIDKDQIAQVIDNIVINAQQAMPDGGSIEIGAMNISFAENEHPPLARGDYVKVSIKDSGIGIPKKIMPRIFDPFYTTKIKGHGLGLATCFSIINRHGGCIDVESQPGKGSTFHVYLPASLGAAAAKDATVSMHKGSGTIIVMDDEAVLRDTFRQMLELMGYTVICKHDGKEAVDFFMSETPKRRFAAMIFDLTVPGGMGGLEAVTEIRKSDKEIPIFVSSGYAENSVMKNPVEYGFTASISKPFTLADLSETLNNHLAI